MSGDAIDELIEARTLIKRAGIELREVPLGSISSGYCRLEDQEIIFIEATLTADEQLDAIYEAVEIRRMMLDEKKITTMETTVVSGR